MDIIQSDEGLRLWMINHLSEILGKHAILKGGMVLRLLDCPRHTNDLDYVFTPFISKKEVVPYLQMIKESLKEFDGFNISTHQINPTHIRFNVVLENKFGRFKTQIEISVSKNCETESISTSEFSKKYNQLPHVVRVMRLDVALAHKLAAWNERRLIRDLYDAYFINRNLDRLPHIETLKERLSCITYSKKQDRKSLPKKISLGDFLVFLEDEVQKINQESIVSEIEDFGQTLGLEAKLKIGIRQMIQSIRNQLCHFCREPVLRRQAQEKGKVFDAVDIDCPFCGNYRVTGNFMEFNHEQLNPQNWLKVKKELQVRSDEGKKFRKIITTEN
ncbi:MAG: nucleotidyl transferase AbiEii/AbiGii toxin family protein [Deltaproteobacteria bacterium]|nr:MAG: nucleotidyl transferase AbiEii/AbiGii toxin family protein [Deltaproteobacteria bacterium]